MLSWKCFHNMRFPLRIALTIYHQLMINHLNHLSRNQKRKEGNEHWKRNWFFLRIPVLFFLTNFLFKKKNKKHKQMIWNKWIWRELPDSQKWHSKTKGWVKVSWDLKEQIDPGWGRKNIDLSMTKKNSILKK